MIVKEWTAIEKKNFAPVYLVYGDEPFLIKETKQLLVRHAISEEEHDFNLSTHDLETKTLEEAMEDAETFPFMGERRLVFVENPSFLTSEKKKEKAEVNLQVLESYLASPAPYTVLVFIAPYEKLDERKKITKQLKQKATVLEAKKLGPNDVGAWINQRLASSGVRMEDRAIAQLVERTGTNLFMLAGEVEKLALYASETQLITLEMVEELTSRTVEQSVFDLVERVVANRTEEALRLYYDLIKQNEEPLKLLALLSGQFRLLYQVKKRVSQGYGQQQIATELKVHPYRVKLAQQQARNFTDRQLASIMLQLADCDVEMKSNGIKKEMVIELFLTRISRTKT